MNEINLIDETFDKNQSHNYHLSIQTSSNGLSFCLLDTITKKNITLRHYPFKTSNSSIQLVNNVSEKMNTDDILKLTFKSVSHMFVDSKNTLVPISFFDHSKEKNYFTFNLIQDPNTIILSNTLTNTVAANVFSYPEDLYLKLNEVFPSIKLSHHSSAFIENLVINSSKWTHPKCYININKSFLNIGIACSKKLEFYNAFNFKDNADIIYYILSVLEQFKLSPLTTEVFMASGEENHDEIFEFVNNYLNMIKFIRPSDHFSYSYIFDELQLTRFSNLFNLALCE
jgi:hypothetical protein